MKLYTLFAFLFIIGSLHSQNNYEPGYYIDNSGTKKSGYIENLDWRSNPSQITFKKSIDTDERVVLQISNIQEFTINGISKYEKHIVNIDRSSDNLSSLGPLREPAMKKESLLLKVLIEGSATLYEYVDGNLVKFFYKKEDLISPLIYKRYIKTNGDIGKNNFFKQQLTNDLICTSGKLPSLENLRYTRSSLVTYFEAYGTCTNTLTSIVSNKEKVKSFRLKALGGINFSSISIDTDDRRGIDYGSSTGFVAGIELENILPFNNNKWSIFIDARYLSFEANTTSEFVLIASNEVRTENASIDYSAIDFGIGARHYMFINDTSSIYIGLNYSIDFISDFSATYEFSNDLETSSGVGAIGLAIGYSNKRISGELRYNTNKDHIGSEFLNNSSEYSNLMITLSYSLFKF